MVENVQNVTCCLICILQRQIWNTIKTLLPVVASWCFICWMYTACFNANDAQPFFFFLSRFQFWMRGWKSSLDQLCLWLTFIPQPIRSLWLLQKACPFSMFVDQKARLRVRKFKEEPRAAGFLHSDSARPRSFSSPLSLSVMHSYIWMLNWRKVFDFPAVTWFNGLRGLTEISRGQPCILSGNR